MGTVWAGFLTLVAKCEPLQARHIADSAKTLLASLDIAESENTTITPYDKFDGAQRITVKFVANDLDDKLGDVLEKMAQGWDVKHAVDEHSAVWNSSDSRQFFCPFVFWANLDIVERASASYTIKPRE
jgi:hypothetical protein